MRPPSATLLLVAAALAALAAPAVPARAAAPPPRAIEGDWRGQLANLRVVLHIKADTDGTLRGTLDSPDQNATGLVADGVALDGDSLHVDMSSIGARLDGTFDAVQKRITGTWRQAQAVVPLVLEKGGTTAEGRRPQDPVPPFPYRSEKIEYVNPVGRIRLAGTLTIPPGRGPFPAALLLSGSGPQDRDETVFGHRPFLVLSDYLTRRGIAVLRVDDRGVGGSGGQLSRATFLDLANDALAGVAYLRARSEIDSSRIGLIGHSEGGMVGPLAAVRARGAVHFLVLLAGVGIPGDELLRRQSSTIARMQGADPGTVEKQDEILARLYALLKEDADSASIAPRVRDVVTEMVGLIPDAPLQSMGGRDAVIAKQMRPLLSPSFRSLVAFDPRPVLAEVRCPVLALAGGKDTQVPAEDNLAGIERAVRSGGNTDVTTREFPDLNHLFQTCTTGSVGEYASIDETFAPAALEAVGDWIAGKTGARPSRAVPPKRAGGSGRIGGGRPGTAR